MAVLSEWDVNLISDYDWFKNFFYKEIAPNFDGVKVFGNTIDMKCRYTKLEWDSAMLHKEVCRLGNELNDSITEMMLFDPNIQMSQFFKKTYVNPKRWGVMIREKQIQDLLEKGLIGK